MTIVIQPHLPVIILVTLLITVFVFVCYGKLKKFDPLDEPKGLVLLCIMLVEWIDGMVKEIVSEDYLENMGPFVGSIAVYILLSNYIGLFGLDNPTRNFSCTLAITLVCWSIFQGTDIRYMGLKGYLKSFVEPIPVFLISNIFSTLAPLISMSMRLFGNIISGSIIMSLYYSATGALAAKIMPFLQGIDIIGPIIGSVLHLYFDLFSGFLQMYIFIMLTMVFTGTRIPEHAKHKTIKEGE